MYLNRGIRPFLAPVRGGVAATAAAAVAAAGFSVGVAFGLAAVTGALLRWEEGGASAVAGALAATAACAAGRGVCLWVRDQVATATAARVKRAVRARVMEKIYELGPGHAWPRGRGGVQPTAVDGVEHLQGYIGFYLPQLLVSWAVPAVLLGVLAAVSWPVAAVVLVCVLTVPFAQRLWRLVLRDRARDHWERFEAFAERVGDTVRGLPTLVALGAADRRRAHLAGAAEELRAATTANMRASLGVSAVMNAAMSVGTAGATLTAALEASRGALPLESVLLVLFLSAECFRPQQELSGYWHEGFYGIAAAGAISRLLETESPVRERPGADPVRWAGPPDIVVENVDFTFPGAAEPALRGVSFAVPAGSVLAVVGASGAGKTTLGRLLLRDMDPDSGRILLQGRDLADLSLAGLRRATARVAQDVVLLSGTVGENIALAAGPPGPENDARVAAAVRRARVDDVAGQLDTGLDSAVGEGGRLLSGGQRQRVALARALAADARLLLLDEATSALDAENEALITDFLRTGRGQRTMVVIAHRLSTVAHADLVLVLDGGRVAEFGPPGKLARHRGHWARLVRAQRAGTAGVR